VNLPDQMAKLLQYQKDCMIDIRHSAPVPAFHPSIARKKALETLQPYATRLSQLQLTVHAGDADSLFRLGELLASAIHLQSVSINLAGRVEHN
jgi:hypothetical protein